jgi:hypothetical protein
MAQFTFKAPGIKEFTVVAVNHLKAMATANKIVTKHGIDYSYAWFDTGVNAYALGHYGVWD